MSRPSQQKLSMQQAASIIQKTTAAYNARAKKTRGRQLSVVSWTHGQEISVPTGQMFQSENGQAVAGLSFRSDIDVIAIANDMTPESTLSTFFHELGHTRFHNEHPKKAGTVEDEAFAIRYSLEQLMNCGHTDIARDEVQKVKEMASKEPYKSAVKSLSNTSIWKQLGG